MLDRCLRGRKIRGKRQREKNEFCKNKIWPPSKRIHKLVGEVGPHTTQYNRRHVVINAIKKARVRREWCRLGKGKLHGGKITWWRENSVHTHMKCPQLQEGLEHRRVRKKEEKIVSMCKKAFVYCCKGGKTSSQTALTH